MKTHLLGITLALGLIVSGNGVGYAGSVAAKPATTSRAAAKPAAPQVSAAEVGSFDIKMDRATIANDPNHHRVTIQGKVYSVPSNLKLSPAFIGQDSSGQVIILTAGGIQGVPETTVNLPPPTYMPTNLPPPTYVPGD